MPSLFFIVRTYETLNRHVNNQACCVCLHVNVNMPRILYVDDEMTSFCLRCLSEYIHGSQREGVHVPNFPLDWPTRIQMMVHKRS